MALPEGLVTLPMDEPVWERCFGVFPLVLIGTRETDGGHDLAPRHMAMPMGWDNWFGFVCSPLHATYRNAVRDRCFTVSYPRPGQVVQASLAAAPRCDPHHKPDLAALEVFPAQTLDGVLVAGCYFWLECRLERVVEDLGSNCLLIGRIGAAHVHVDALRDPDREDNELIHQSPLLSYLHPGRFAVLDRSQHFPYPLGFKR